ncbi:hypothetical protein GCM10027273_00280 [Nocardioides pakistanensis]
MEPYLQAASSSTELGFPWWLQVTHLVNFLFLGLLVRSGWEILASHPRLYWRNDCGSRHRVAEVHQGRGPHGDRRLHRA